jgi:hypothetical protein
MRLAQIDYAPLNDRQTENHSFRIVSGVVADYGFSTLRLTADWEGTDLVAQHQTGVTFLPVQPDPRPCFAEEYRSQKLWNCPPVPGGLCRFAHDEVLTLLRAAGRYAGEAPT